MHTPFSPEFEKIRVSDLRGLISRKVIGVSSFKPSPDKLVVKSPPTPVTSNGASVIQQALGAYNGWMDFDHWLNLSNTTWSEGNKVLRVLMGDPGKADQYLQEIGFDSGRSIAGRMAGKLFSMKAICLFRELHEQLSLDHEAPYAEIYHKAGQLNYFLTLTQYNQHLTKKIMELVPVCPTLSEFELELFAAYCPVRNLLHARRIFKKRVKRTIENDFYNLLQLEKLDTKFTTHFLFGIFNRLYAFNGTTEHSGDFLHLFKIIQLYKLIAHTDKLFIRQTLGLLLSEFDRTRSIRSEPIIMWYVFRYIYQLALQDKSLAELIYSLKDLSTQLEIEICVHPHSLAMTYQAIPYFDLAWANTELEEVVIVRVN
jgi:hypothetical protein